MKLVKRDPFEIFLLGNFERSAAAAEEKEHGCLRSIAALLGGEVVT